MSLSKLLLFFTIIVLDCDCSFVEWHSHTIAKSSLISRVNGQAGIEHFSIFWSIVIHNGHIERKLMHIIIELAQTKSGESTIVTRSYTDG